MSTGLDPVIAHYSEKLNSAILGPFTWFGAASSSPVKEGPYPTGESFDSGLIVPPLGHHQVGRPAAWFDELVMHRLNPCVVLFNNLRLAPAPLKDVTSDAPLETDGLGGTVYQALAVSAVPWAREQRSRGQDQLRPLLSG